MVKERRTVEQRVSDPASLVILQRTKDAQTTSFGRVDAQSKLCGFGKDGLCCRICYMGPCRITAKAPRGVCGADADTIVARNYLREVAGGVAAHSEHGRHLTLLFREVAQGKRKNYEIRDEKALRRNARNYGIEESGRDKLDVARDLAECLLHEFSRQQSPLSTLALAPLKRQGVWQKHDIEPRGIDRTTVECLHRTTIGVDHDFRSLLLHAMRTSLSDGWGGSRIASIVSDILFGTPQPVRSRANLGVLGETTVNILVHGHEPALSEMLAIASRDPEVIDAARSVGADGITLAGVCCTANEVLMRHGIPVAGNFLQQELALLTGAVEMMVTDVQCCMPSLPQVAAAYHTEIVSTNDAARTIGATHCRFERGRGMQDAKALLIRAINRYPHRDLGKMAIPSYQEPLIAGFSVDAIKYILGGSYRASFRPLNDAIMQGRIRGVCGIVGCNNPRVRMDDYATTLTRELIKNNVLVLETGCAAIASAKMGLLTPETALREAGHGLREVCEAVGMPPVLHMGSCVDNSRILEAATEIVLEGGLGDDLSEVPAVGVAPEWMSEKAIAIGCYFVASGIDVILGHPFHVGGSDNVTRFLNEDTREMFGASFSVRQSPHEAAEKILQILHQRRERLGINQKAARKLMDMKARRELHV
ncbi:anaerobic carbon-monoxide dehydrogenase catalytic subunit [Myxococcota bacterium]